VYKNDFDNWFILNNHLDLEGLILIKQLFINFITIWL